MKKKARHNLIIGIFVTVGILLFIGAVYYIGSQQALFGSKVRVTANFKNVGGLQSGNNVRFSGIKIGVVEQIEIASDSMVRVYMLIDNDASEFIKKDAIASIDSEGLMGNKIMSISSGSSSSPSVKDDDNLASKEPLGIEDVIESVKGTADNAKKLTANLNTISEQIKNAEGLLGKIVSDPEMAHRVDKLVISLERTGSNAARITSQIEQATSEINGGDGLLSRALYDSTWSRDIDQTLDSVKLAGRNISQSSQELKRFMKKLNDNKGAIDMLLNDTTMARDLQSTMENIKIGTQDLDEVMNTIDNSWILNVFSSKDKDKDKKKK